MTEFVMAGGAVALLTLIFSETPFVNLTYFIVVQTSVDWEQWGMITGTFIITLMGATIWRRFKQ